MGPQTPIAASLWSEPEPDISVTRVMAANGGHPMTADLAVEVTLTTHRTDLRIKPPIYAAAMVGEYWVIDLAERRAVLHADPAEGAYRTVLEVGPAHVLCFRGVEILLVDLLG